MVKTDWERVGRKTDKEIRQAVASDPDAAPIASAEWFKHVQVQILKPKKAVSVRLDQDILEWFRQHGKGYQTRINAVLRAYVDSQK
jgi:uncharacterized protein (DUF4415 family)